MAIHKLLKNVAVVGTVKYMDYVPEREVNGSTYGAQISLNGNWDGIGDAKIYLPQAVATQIIHDEMADVIDGDVPKFTWKCKGKVQVLKAEEGKTTRTSVLALDVVKPAQPATNGQPPKAEASGDPWAELGNTYAKAKQIATKVWGADYDPTALVAATATVFIRATSQGMTATPKAPKPVPPQAAALATATKIRDDFDAMPEPIQRGIEEDMEIPF